MTLLQQNATTLPLWVSKPGEKYVFCCSEVLALSFITESEPGIRHGNEDSRGNENRKSQKNIFPVEKNRQAYFFL